MDGPLSFPENVSRDYAMRVLDQTLEQIQTYALILRKQRNDFAPVSHLPPEILCKIFSIVRADYPKAAAARKPLGWLKFTHVCRYWRDIAIGAPTLWAHIDDPILNSRPCLEKILERSAGAPLSLDADAFLCPLVTSGLALALHHNHRIRRVSLIVPPGEWHRLRSAFQISAPQLECLSLNCLPPTRSAVFGLEETLSEFPNLQYLALSNFKVKWSLSPSFKLHALTRLQLRDLQKHTRPTWSQFGDALRAMPKLEVLDLQNALPEGDPIHSKPTRILLPSLHTLLVYSSPVQKVGNLLRSCIAILPTTNICIRSYSHLFPDLRDNIQTLLSEIAPSLLNMHAFQTLVSVEPDRISSDTGIYFKLYVDALADEEMLSHNSIIPRVELVLSWPEATNPTSARQEMDFITASIVGAESLEGIRHVYLESVPHLLSTDTFAKTFGMLPRLCYIMAGSWECDILIDALQQDSDRSFSYLGINAYFPNLSTIYLHGHVYQPEREFQYRNLRFDHFHVAAVPVSELLSCFQQRSERGVPIENLTFKAYPRLGRVDVDRLQAFVLKPIRWTVDGAFKFGRQQRGL